MKTKVFLVIISLALVFSSFHVQGYDEQFLFHDDIVPGKTFTWTVKELSYSGDITSSDFNFTVGDYTVSQDDKLKVEITKDPDVFSEEYLWQEEAWFDFYLNDVLIFNSSEIYGMDSDNDLIGYFPIWPIYPVTFVNESGTYDVFQLIYDESQAVELNESDSTSETWGDYIFYTDTKQILDFSLENDVFEIYLYVYSNVTQVHTVTQEKFYSIGELTMIIRIDAIRGLLNQQYMKIHGETNIQNMEMEGPVNGDFVLNILRDGYKPPGENTLVIPFEGLYALFGVGIVALVIYRKKRH